MRGERGPRCAPSLACATLPPGRCSQVWGPAGQGALDLVQRVEPGSLEGWESWVMAPGVDRGSLLINLHGRSCYVGHTPHLQLSAARCRRSWHEGVGRAAR